MSCCSPTEFKKEEINGTCDLCGEQTVDGFAYESCGYSPQSCEKCDCRPCDHSC